MCMLDEIRAKRDEIYAIARKHKAEKLWVFGSCARKEERPDSDVDFLVKFSPEVGYCDYVAIEQGVSDIVGRDVDVVSSRVLPSSQGLQIGYAGRPWQYEERWCGLPRRSPSGAHDAWCCARQ